MAPLTNGASTLIAFMDQFYVMLDSGTGNARLLPHPCLKVVSVCMPLEGQVQALIDEDLEALALPQLHEQRPGFAAGVRHHKGIIVKAISVGPAYSKLLALNSRLIPCNLLR